MMTAAAAAARAALLAQAVNGEGGRGGGPPQGPFPAGSIRPAALNSGYLYLPPGAAAASAAWAAAGARFGHLGTYPLSLSHATLSYPYSLSAAGAGAGAHGPGAGGKASSLLEIPSGGGAAAMRGLSVEAALREAHLGVSVAGKLAAHHQHHGHHLHLHHGGGGGVVRGPSNGGGGGVLFSPARELDGIRSPGECFFLVELS